MGHIVLCKYGNGTNTTHLGQHICAFLIVQKCPELADVTAVGAWDGKLSSENQTVYR